MASTGKNKRTHWIVSIILIHLVIITIYLFRDKSSDMVLIQNPIETNEYTLIKETKYNKLIELVEGENGQEPYIPNKTYISGSIKVDSIYIVGDNAHIFKIDTNFDPTIYGEEYAERYYELLKSVTENKNNQ